MELDLGTAIAVGIAIFCIGVIAGRFAPKGIGCAHNWEKKTADVDMTGGYGEGVVVLWTCSECPAGRGEVHFADQVKHISSTLAESMIKKAER